MTLTVLRLLAVLFTAVAMAAGFAHLLELPNKMRLSRPCLVSRLWAPS